MRKRKIGLLAIAALMTVAAASCSGGNGGSGNANYPTILDANNDSDYAEIFSSVTLDLTNVKQVFYLGDEFTTEGLKVTLNSFKADKKTGTVIQGADMIHRETNNFSIDASAVDMSQIGKYDVLVSTRMGVTTKVQKYTIEVKSSLLESTPGISYISGIEVSYTNNSNVKEYVIEDDINIVESDLKYKIHKKTIDASLNQTDEVLPESAVDSSKVSIDFSKINPEVVGTYPIIITYDGGSVTAGGQTIQNKAVSCVLVNVKNDAKKIELVNDDEVEFEATVSGIDLSNWQIQITRERKDPEIVQYSDELFEVSGLDSFLWNKTQTITVTLKENGITFKQGIIVGESSTQDIKKYINLTKGEEVTEGETKMYALEDTDFIFGPNVTYTDRTNNNDKFGALKFDTRFTIKGSSQPVKIVMDKPGAIVVFYASTGDEERELVFRNATEDLDTAVTDSVKQVIRQAVFEVPAAGTYYIVNPAGGIYIHGLVVAKNK